MVTITSVSSRPGRMIAHGAIIRSELHGIARRSSLWQIAVSLAEELGRKDAETLAHSLRVMQISEMIAREIGLPEEHVERIKLGALLHDIGKIDVALAILRKTGELTPAEKEEIERHPLKGTWLLRAWGIEWGIEDAVIAEIVLHHHERLDGNGYYGKVPSLEARIVTAADAYDVMMHDRPYAKAISNEEAVTKLIRETRKKFDPEVIRVLLKLIQEGIAFEPEPAAASPSAETGADTGSFTLLLEVDSMARTLARTAEEREIYLDADYLREQMPLFSRYFVDQDSELTMTLERGAKYEDIRLAFLKLMGADVGSFAGELVSIFGESVNIMSEGEAQLTPAEEELAAKLTGYLPPLLHDVGNLLAPIYQAAQGRLLHDIDLPEALQKQATETIARLYRNFNGLREAVAAGSRINSRATGWLPILVEMQNDYQSLQQLFSAAENGKFRIRIIKASAEAADTLASYLSLIIHGEESKRRVPIKLSDLFELASLHEANISGKVDALIAVSLSMMKAVLRNLKGNAQKAMKSLPQAERRIEISVRANKEEVTIEFKNPGHIPDELLVIDETTGRQRIFNLGTSTGKGEGHEGRGGDIIYSFTKAQGGSAKAENQNGMAVFTLVFPGVSKTEMGQAYDA